MEGPSFPQNRNIWTFCWAQDMVCPTVRVMCRNFFPRLSCPQFFLCCRCCCQLALRLKVSSHFFPACLSTFLSLCVCVSLLMFNFFVFSLFLFFMCRESSAAAAAAAVAAFAFFPIATDFFSPPLCMLCVCEWVGRVCLCVCECFCSFAFAFANRWRCRRLLASFFLFVIRFIIIVHRSVAHVCNANRVGARERQIDLSEISCVVVAAVAAAETFFSVFTFFCSYIPPPSTFLLLLSSLQRRQRRRRSILPSAASPVIRQHLYL